MVHGITAGVHGVVALGAAHWLSTPLALAVAAVALAGTSLRFHAIAGDPARPRWVVHLVDEPVFVHWGACVFASFLVLPIFVGGVVVGLGSPVASPSLAALVAYAGGIVLSAWSVWVRRRLVRVVHHEVPVVGLAPAFDGFRIVHLTDLHVGGFDDQRRAEEWIALANAQRPDLVAVTGDLVTTGDHWYAAVAAALSRLEGREGTLAVMGNHDQWNEEALVGHLRDARVVVLRNERHAVTRGSDSVVFAGLGDRFTERDDLRATLAGIASGVPVVLLSHYPVVFDEAAALGADLVLSGHTHGGQVGLPPLHDVLNVAAFSGERPRGTHRIGDSTLVVNAGLGTSGPPMRLGIPPEVVVVVLRAA